MKAAKYRTAVCKLAALVLLASATAAGAQQQGKNPAAAAKDVPTLDAFAQTPLPPGKFAGWCGQQDKYLMEAERELQFYDAGVKYATFPRLDRTIQCGNDGHHIVLIDHHEGTIWAMDVRSGASDRLASYQRNDSYPLEISVVSPDLTTIATSAPLMLEAGAGGLRLIEVNQPQGQQVRGIGWSENSSFVFSVTESTKKQTIEIFDADDRRIGLGSPPPGSFFSSGWISGDGQQLLLLLDRDKEIFSPSFVIKCRISGWKCNRIADNLVDASAGGAVLATVGSDQRLKAGYEGTPPIPRRYVVDISNPQTGLRVRQVFKSSMSRYSMSVSVAPSGKKLVVKWYASEGCPTSAQCEAGIMVDLTKRIK